MKVYLCMTLGSNDHMSEGRVRIAARSKKDALKIWEKQGWDRRYLGPIRKDPEGRLLIYKTDLKAKKRGLVRPLV